MFDFKTYATFMKLSLIERKSSLKQRTGLAFLFSFFPIYAFSMHLGLLLDHLFFPGFRRQKIESPIFIFGNPRSGTTFFHRLLSRDEEHFVFFKTHEMLTPSLSIRAFFRMIGRLDRLVGAPLSRKITEIERETFEDFNHIHKIGLQETEEDEGLFVFLFNSPYLYLLFPFMREVPRLELFDELPEAQRRRMMDYYVGCLRRHLYHKEAGEKRFLSKNPSFAGKINAVYERFPDAKFIYLVRHPYESIGSFVSGVYRVWSKYFDITPDSPEIRQIVDVLANLYRHAHEGMAKLPPESLMVVNYHELVADPKRIVEGVYEHFGLPLSPSFSQMLAEETERSRKRKSKHRYQLDDYGITKEEIYEALPDIFERYGFER